MVNETLSTVDLNESQSILHRLNVKLKKELFALLNEEKNDGKCWASDYDYNDIRIWMYD